MCTRYVLITRQDRVVKQLMTDGGLFHIKGQEIVIS